MGWPAWTEHEKRIVRTQYPMHGPHATVTALAKAGYARTLIATQYQAHILGARMDRRQWCDTELTILRQHYPSTGSAGVKAALAARKHYRSTESIWAAARREGIKYDPPPAPPPVRVKRPSHAERRKLTAKQRAVMRALPYDGLLDADDPPPDLARVSIRQVARTLEARKLVHHEGKGLYRLTLRGLPVWRELTRGGDA